MFQQPGRRLAALAVMALVCVVSVSGLVGTQEAKADTVKSPVRPAAQVKTYLASEDQRTFSDGPSGWKGYQEQSLLCFVRGVTCPKWDTEWKADGGPDGAGDGFLNVHGTSLAAAPCTPQAGNGRWDSPLFTYTSKNAKSWRIKFNTKQTYLLLGDGHGGIAVDLIDESGKTVANAFPPQPTLPTNHWRTIDLAFDGKRLEYGHKYSIALKVVAIHAETAGSWGDVSFDNVSMETSTNGGVLPITQCRAGQNDVAKGLSALLNVGRMLDFCKLTEPVGNTVVSPVTQIATELANKEPFKEILDRGAGAFMVVDRTDSQFFGWFFSSGSLPPSDPRQLLFYAEDGTVGQAANFAVVFVTYQPMAILDEMANGPGGMMGTLERTLKGQLGNLEQVLSDPVGELLDIDPEWSVENLTQQIENIIGPLQNPKSKPAQIGGKVFHDLDSDGIRDDSEPGVANVGVKLYDCDDKTLVNTVLTDTDGSYKFKDVDPTYAPEGYCLEFDKSKFPGVVTFSPEHVGSNIKIDSDVNDQASGATSEFYIDPGETDLTWNAGLVGPEEAVPAVPLAAGIPVLGLALIGGGAMFWRKRRQRAEATTV